MKHTRGAFGAVLALALAMAATRMDGAYAAEDEPAFLSLGVGYFDIVHRDDDAADFRLEYRHDKGIWLARPWAGVEATGDGALYGVGGILFDIPVGDRLAVVPSFGVGAYSDGDGPDLGHTVEFRSQLEIAYRFENRSRLGVAFGHISNASLGDRNPGVEILSLYYSLPIGSLFGE